ncbi:hypothetical protein BHU72_10605 [Desulfuribacillus stibiiarsenatis]|uniref:DUF2953 domain-containing protein n=1 Tax=Desulfuribacillus stibiiarsenatis TaxID=1390249 RepID=A0A1E5L2A1_9FIRM|nr:hypothetical protein [Desulfuribacillus stibiiarsenatis]OEH84257.1 hypothetical protein BHU72_10605 [Desulfuribacillus stibiiarsenatis]
MSLFLDLILIATSIIILLLILIIVLPFHYQVKYNNHEKYLLELQVSLATILGMTFKAGSLQKKKLTLWIGALNKDIHINENKKIEEEEETKNNKQIDRKKVEEKEEELENLKTVRSSQKANGRFLLKYIRFQNVKDVYRLLADLINMISPKKFKIIATIGFYEPHYTAWLLGAVEVFRGLKPNYSISIIPAWEEEIVDVDIKVSGKVILLVILLRVLKFIFAKSTRRIWISWIRYKINPKKFAM